MCHINIFGEKRTPQSEIDIVRSTEIIVAIRLCDFVHPSPYFKESYLRLVGLELRAVTQGKKGNSALM
jgi:hypothetical protein